MRLKTWLAHAKIFLVGDKELETNGKLIPCKGCDKLFKSYRSFGTDSFLYSAMCEECSDRKQRG